MEIADPPEAATTPVQIKPAPQFAQLTDVSDGTPLHNDDDSSRPDEGHEQSQKKNDEEDTVSVQKTRRARYRSHEPEYNPWDA